MTNKTYDKAKWVAQIALPAVGTLWFAIAKIWGLPDAVEILGTITAVDAFLGVLLGISTQSYNRGMKNCNGVIKVTRTAEGNHFTFDMKDHPADLFAAGKDRFVFKLQHGTEDSADIGSVPHVEMPEA